MAIDSQRIGQTPGVQEIGLGSAGSFSIPIAFRTLGVNRINGDTTFQELFDSRALAGLNGYSQVRIALDEFFPLHPTFGRVFEGQFLNDFALRVHHHNVVMVLSPVKAGVMGNGLPMDLFSHVFSSTRPQAFVVSRPDTGTLAGCSSLRLCDKSPRVGRCSGLNPRRIRAAQPCSTRGLAAGTILLRPQNGFKTHPGKVIHSLTALSLPGTLRSAMNNFG